jgi:hypothetical protein
MLRRAAVYLHNAQLRNLPGARLLNQLDIGRATVVEVDSREVRFVQKQTMHRSKVRSFDRFVGARRRESDEGDSMGCH